MSDPKTLNVYATQAAEYAALTDEGATVDPLVQRFISQLPKGGRALDLGCGPGASAGQMAEAGLLVDAWDPVPEMLELAARFPGVTTRQAGFGDLTEPDIYDGIWVNFSMLHTPRAAWPTQLAAIARALRPNGAFYIGTKLGTGEERDKIGRLYTYVTEGELMNLMQTAGLKPEFTTRGRDKGLSGEMADWIAVLARG